MGECGGSFSLTPTPRIPLISRSVLTYQRMKTNQVHSILRSIKSVCKNFVDSCRGTASYIVIVFLLIKGDRLICYYSRGREDQSGARIHDEIMAASFSFANNITYCGPVFNQVLSSDETEPLRQLLGLPSASQGRGGAVIPPEIYRERNVTGVFSVLKEAFMKSLGIKLSAHPDEIFPEMFISSLQRKSVLTIKPRINQVVLHVRRGDVSAEMHPSRYTGIRYYLELIDQLSHLDSRLCFTVHSQSKGLSVGEIQSLSAVCNLILDADLVKAWEDMINAEILVLAKSSFSYVPALYSMGTIIYQPFWHLPKSNWHNLQNVPLPQVMNIVYAKRALSGTG